MENNSELIAQCAAKAEKWLNNKSNPKKNLLFDFMR